MRPEPSEYRPYFDTYISLIPGDRVVPVLMQQLEPFLERFGSLTEEQGGFRYAPDKWSVREVIGHLIDTERVFGYRALWIARGETMPLPPFEQDGFVRTAGHDKVPIVELVDEFCALRESHLLMFNHLPREAWTRIGTVSGHPLSTRAVAFIMAGHVIHHMGLLQERYGV